MISPPLQPLIIPYGDLWVNDQTVGNVLSKIVRGAVDIIVVQKSDGSESAPADTGARIYPTRIHAYRLAKSPRVEFLGSGPLLVGKCGAPKRKHWNVRIWRLPK